MSCMHCLSGGTEMYMKHLLSCQVDSERLGCPVREQSYSVVLSVDYGSMTLSNVDVFAD